MIMGILLPCAVIVYRGSSVIIASGPSDSITGENGISGSNSYLCYINIIIKFYNIIKSNIVLI